MSFETLIRVSKFDWEISSCPEDINNLQTEFLSVERMPVPGPISKPNISLWRNDYSPIPFHPSYRQPISTEKYLYAFATQLPKTLKKENVMKSSKKSSGIFSDPRSP